MALALLGGATAASATSAPLFSSELPQERLVGAVQTGFLAALGVAASKALFCYDAWNTVTFAAAEVRDPGAQPAARADHRHADHHDDLHAGGGGRTCTCFRSLRWRRFPRTASPPRRRGCCSANIGGQLIAAAILVSTFGCINGMILGGARVLYRDGGRRAVPAHGGRS